MNPFPGMSGQTRPLPGSADWTDTHIVSLTSGESAASLPADLREWIDPTTLSTWIREEVANLDWDTHFLQCGAQPPEYRPKVILSVLAFACLSQTYGSEE